MKAVITSNKAFPAILCFVLLVSLPGLVQGETFDIGVNFGVAAPQEEFRDHVGRNGYGVTAEGLYIVGKRSPLRLGLQGGVLNYGYENNNVPLSKTIQRVNVDVNTSNDIAFFHFLLRLQVPRGSFRPYVEGLAGWQNFATTSRVESEEFTSSDDEDNIIAETRNYEDTSGVYGYGGGFYIKLTKLETTIMWLDVKGHYLYGGETSYLKEGDIIETEDGIIYRASRSQTHMLLWHLGVAFTF
jgi:hypothetical protein